MRLLKKFIQEKSVGRVVSTLTEKLTFPTKKVKPVYQPIKRPQNSSQITSEVDSIVSIYEEKTQRIVEKGLTNAASTLEQTASGNDYVEKQIVLEHQRADEEIRHLTSTVRLNMDRKISSIKNKLEDGSIEREQQDQYLIRKREAMTDVERKVRGSTFTRRLEKLYRKIGSVEGVLTYLYQEISQIHEKQRMAQGRFKQLFLNVYDGQAPEKKFLNRGYNFVAVVVALFLIEIAANFQAFQSVEIGGSNFGALAIGVLAAVGQALSAKALGFVWDQHKPKEFNLYLGLTLFFCLLVGYARLTMDGSLILKVVYLTINFIIAIATVIFARMYIKFRGFFAALKERNSITSEMVIREERIRKIEAFYDSLLKEMNEWCRTESENQIRISKEALTSHINELESELSTLDMLVTNAGQKLLKIKEASLERYFHLLLQSKQSLLDSHLTERKNDYGNGKSSMLKKMSVVLVFSSCGLMGCFSSEPSNAEVIYDQTDQTVGQDVLPMLDFITSHLPDDTHTGNWGETTVTLSQIGEISSQSTRTVTLKSSESFWLRNENEHKKRPEIFRNNLKAALDELVKPTPELDYSYVHRNFYYRLSELAKKPGRKLVISWCDLILNNREINFYKYQKNPEKIWEERDFLISKMTEDYHLDNLAGIHLINIYQPNRSNDDLHEAAKRFFRYYWESLGMTVEFKTSIPSTTKVLNAEVQ